MNFRYLLIALLLINNCNSNAQDIIHKKKLTFSPGLIFFLPTDNQSKLYYGYGGGITFEGEYHITNKFSLISEIGLSGIAYSKQYKDATGYTGLFKGVSYSNISLGTRYYLHRLFGGVSFGYGISYVFKNWADASGNMQIIPHIGYSISNRLNISSQYFSASLTRGSDIGGFISLKLQANLKK